MKYDLKSSFFSSIHYPLGPSGTAVGGKGLYYNGYVPFQSIFSNKKTLSEYFHAHL